MTKSPKIPKGWKQHPPCAVLHPGSNNLYQKKIGDLFINIVEWEHSDSDKKSYELEIQIPSELGITGKTINITNFSYHELDFKKIEKDGKKLIKVLIK